MISYLSESSKSIALLRVRIWMIQFPGSAQVRVPGLGLGSMFESESEFGSQVWIRVPGPSLGPGSGSEG